MQNSEPERFGAIDALTDSDSSQKDEEEKDVLGRKRKRRPKRPTSALTPREKLVDKNVCRSLLTQRCPGGKCKRNCLGRFSRSAMFAQFMEFRQKWKELHKLDQDRLEFCQKLRYFFPDVVYSFLCYPQVMSQQHCATWMKRWCERVSPCRRLTAWEILCKLQRWVASNNCVGSFWMCKFAVGHGCDCIRLASLSGIFLDVHFWKVLTGFIFNPVEILVIHEEYWLRFPWLVSTKLAWTQCTSKWYYALRCRHPFDVRKDKKTKKHTSCN